MRELIPMSMIAAAVFIGIGYGCGGREAPSPGGGGGSGDFQVCQCAAGEFCEKTDCAICFPLPFGCSSCGCIDANCGTCSQNDAGVIIVEYDLDDDFCNCDVVSCAC